MPKFNIKTNRTFTFIRRWSWIITITVAIGGLWVPKLGLLVVPIMLSLIALSFFKGRYWCGNFCPHGSLYDRLMLLLSRNLKIPAFFRSRVLRIAFFGWFGFMLTRKFINAFSAFGTDQFLDKLGFIFVTSYLMVLVLGGILSVFVSPRTWCNFCPMGFLQMLSYKLGKLLGVAKRTDSRITVASAEMCHKCGKCSRVCPMQLTPYQEFSGNNQFDNEACIRCSTCIENCPAGILSLGSMEKAIEIKKSTDTSGYDKRRKVAARIADIRKLKDDIIEYTFKLQNNEKIEYSAGQFILVKVQDNPEIKRAYSISSYNEDGTTVSVTMKSLKDGYGSTLVKENFKLGDTIELEGPMGRELVVDKNAEKIVLVAGGIGITPFLPIVTDLVNNPGRVKEFKLIYGANYSNEFIYDEEFRNFEALDSRFKYIKVVAFDEEWEGKKGFVTNVIKEMDLEGYKVYMCGPKPMTEAVLKILKELNINEENVFLESA